MTEKENFLLVARGEMPEWVPRYLSPPNAGTPYKPAVIALFPSVLNSGRTPDGGGHDVFGVEYTPTDSTGGMALPTPGKVILRDITKWRDVIKAPDLSDVDWEQMASRDLRHIDRANTALEMGTHFGYFQHLMAFMGFEEGLMAMYEEPGEVYALFSYLADFYDEVLKKSLEYYKPDLVLINDDTATAKNPFFSLEMYRELVKPFQMRQGALVTREGLPVDMHNCGRCEDFIDDWFDFGVTMWNPAQVMNDLAAVKKKYGRRLALVGCWDSSGPPSWPEATEELVRSEVRRCIDEYAADGGFCFWGSVYGEAGDERAVQKRTWITDEYDSYGRTFYAK
jgi:hypothetical protein